MSNIEHLFENALSWLENGWNMSEFGKDKVNHELLGYVDASAEEIIAMARYVFNTRCAWCDEKNVISLSELMECLEVSGCKADKKSIYKDIAAIRETIFPVIYVSNRGYYAVKKGEEHADR